MKYTEQESRLIYDFLTGLQEQGVTTIDQAIDEINDRTKWSIRAVYGYFHYDDYLRSDEWRKLRQQVIDRDGGECVICGNRDNLHVHHLNYKEGIDEDGANLVTLCQECHHKVHEIVKRTFSPRTGEGDVLYAAEKELAARMSQIVNEEYPAGIEGRRKVRAIQILRGTYAGQPHRIMPDHSTMGQQVKKRKK